MSQESTRDRIIAAAEFLFADRGFAETSLRLITSRANVNLASVNYHFGSKKSLIQAVFDRFMAQLTAELVREMEPLRKNSSMPHVEQVLATFLRPLQALDRLEPQGAAIFMRLLGRAYAEEQGHLRRFILSKYGNALDEFRDLLRRAHPDIPAQEVFWRLHFMLGALVFAIGGGNALRDIAAADFQENIELHEVVARLIPFLAAGFKAPITYPRS
ncbi:TetR/AcrR family transcriptional regulator [Permianibacter aggregans]|uniref:TetR family transcriptional regulator n=1 Tax=Permianibacter aggregans TaxID=1510150 RepID=A0A4R6UMS3_9GAMM|nr:TetR/AcrR family transcriptional regulator [Permianibacter aggregans]QGX41164.1 TetR/AcrR family transcriptional regulator [Permianibacter aggregans]TDQ44524.1 TetR family transcriptional regulator [Permianibacter aggregans]